MMEVKNDGYIVVETIGAFIPFILIISMILSLVNIVTMQTRVHYAMTQAANTLSMYCYTLEAMNVAGKLEKTNSDADTVRSEIDEVKTDINGVVTALRSLSFTDVGVHGKNLANKLSVFGGDIADHPDKVIDSLVSFAIDNGASALLEILVRPLVGRYLSNGSENGNEYLKRVNVAKGLSGLEFYEFDTFKLNSVGHRNSVLVDKTGSVKLIVQYKVEFKIGNLKLPFDPTLKVTQTVATKAWLGGKGKGYWK